MKAARLAVVILALLVGAVAVFTVAALGLDESMAVGALAGLGLGAGLTLMGGRGLRRALESGQKSALVVHLWGGLLLRMLLLALGFGFFVLTGWGSPVGFALAFLAGGVVALVRQVWVFAGAPATA
jgi:hypothetical protein